MLPTGRRRVKANRRPQSTSLSLGSVMQRLSPWSRFPIHQVPSISWSGASALVRAACATGAKIVREDRLCGCRLGVRLFPEEALPLEMGDGGQREKEQGPFRRTAPLGAEGGI